MNYTSSGVAGILKSEEGGKSSGQTLYAFGQHEWTIENRKDEVFAKDLGPTGRLAVGRWL